MLSATPKLAIGCACALILCLAWRAPAVQGPFSDLAAKAFEKARNRCQQEPQSHEAAWQFSRACFDLAEFATNKTERAEIAETGIAAAQSALRLQSNSAPGHYYLGMSLAQLARTRGLSALRIVDDMERELRLARDLDERIDYAGPDRYLGLLYRDAPSLGSVGSRSKARHCLQRAVTLAPEYPDNRLNLIESYLKWGDRAAARPVLKSLREDWTAARTRFTGPSWNASWVDWEGRLGELAKKLGEAPLGSPRHAD